MSSMGMTSLVGIDMFAYCSRESNLAAAAVARLALDETRDIQMARYLEPGAMNQFIGIALWSVGMSRGHVGVAACVGCAVMRLGQGEEPPDNCTVSVMCGIRVFTQIIFCTGRVLGFATSLHAEFEAACIARREAISWLRASGIVISTVV